MLLSRGFLTTLALTLSFSASAIPPSLERSCLDELIIRKRPDVIVTNRPRQPKNAGAFIVKRYGIATPGIFESFQEAIVKGLPFIARSEHPSDHDGLSGIIDSFTFSQIEFNEAHELAADLTQTTESFFERALVRNTGMNHVDWRSLLIAYVLRQQSTQSSDVELKVQEVFRAQTKTGIRFFARVTGKTEKEIEDQVSFSFWQYQEGMNRSIVADSAIPGRYHIFTRYFPEEEGKTAHLSWAVIEAGKVIRSYPSVYTDELLENLPQTIAFYEKIRNLPEFDPTMIPIVEFQTIEKEGSVQNSFLQYHQTREIAYSRHTLSRPLENGELEANFVRGATPPEGIDVEITWWDSGTLISLFSASEKVQLPEQEEGGLDYHPFYPVVEALARKRTVTLRTKNFEDLAELSRDDSHFSMSTVFKSAVSVLIDFHSLVPEADREIMEKKAEETGAPSRFRLHITSDGHRAVVKYLGYSL